MKSLTPRKPKPIQSQADLACGDDASPLSSNIKLVGVLQRDEAFVVVGMNGAPTERYTAIPAALLGSHTHGALEAFLLKNGLAYLLTALTPKEVSASLRAFLTSSKARVIESPGHHVLSLHGDACEVFVHDGICNFTTEKPRGAEVVLVGRAAAAQHSGQSIAKFNKTFASILAASPRLLYTLLFSMAALLLACLGLPPMTLALIGRSSIGKTIIQRAVAYWVNGDGEVRMFNGTAKGLQKYLNELPARAAFFEDAHGAESGKSLAALIMTVGNGAAQRLLATTTANAEQLRRTQASLVVSAEFGVFHSIAAGRTDLTAGVAARMFEIHPGKHGMFDELCGHESSEALATHINANSEEFASVVGKAFITEMIASWAKLPNLWATNRDMLRRKIKTAAGIENLDGLNGRVLDQLAIVAFAGELAVRWSVLKLERQVVYDALGLLFREHMDRTGIGRTPVSKAVIDAVRHFLQANPSKFAPIEQAQSERMPNGLAGYIKRTKEGEVLHLFFPEALKHILPKGTESEALEILDQAGHLARQASRGRQFQARFRPFGGGEGAPRIAMDFVAVRTSILGDAV